MMRKRIFAAMLSFVLILSFTVSVFAKTKGEVVLTELTLLTGGTIYTGQEFSLQAVTLKHGSEVSDSWHFMNEDFMGSQTKPDTSYINRVTLVAPAAAGTYPISYHIQMSTPSGNTWTGEATIYVVIQERITTDNPAAPAVANAILKEAGIDHRYPVEGEKYGNYITDVSDEMAPGTDFRGVSKDDVEAYRAAIWNFLVEKGADLN